jgi:hypothetical protein
MREHNFLSEERTDDDRPDRRDPDGGRTNGLPPEPNPEHPRHYYDEAHRTYKRLKSGRWEWADLGARKWGLLAFWYPDVVATNGGDPA